MNLLGDVELDARGMRALAHPVRLAILRRLREHGSSTATRLAPHVGASPSVTSWHLRHLAEHGLVEDAPRKGQGRQRWWRAVGRGFRFDVDAADPQAAEALRDALEETEGNLIGEWLRDTRPLLEPEWVAVSTRWNTGVVATADELRRLEEAIEELLAPLANREPGDAPLGSRRVRILRHTLASADEVDRG